MRTSPEKLQLALDLERSAIDRLNHAIALCVSSGDNGSRALLEEILERRGGARRLGRASSS